LRENQLSVLFREQKEGNIPFYERDKDCAAVWHMSNVFGLTTQTRNKEQLQPMEGQGIFKHQRFGNLQLNISLRYNDDSDENNSDDCGKTGGCS
jgi:hypothetical protein